MSSQGQQQTKADELTKVVNQMQEAVVNGQSNPFLKNRLLGLVDSCESSDLGICYFGRAILAAMEGNYEELDSKHRSVMNVGDSHDIINSAFTYSQLQMHASAAQMIIDWKPEGIAPRDAIRCAGIFANAGYISQAHRFLDYLKKLDSTFEKSEPVKHALENIHALMYFFSTLDIEETLWIRFFELFERRIVRPIFSPRLFSGEDTFHCYSYEEGGFLAKEFVKVPGAVSPEELEALNFAIAEELADMDEEICTNILPIFTCLFSFHEEEMHRDIA